MGEDKPRHEMATKPVLYEVPGMQEVEVRRDLEYSRRDGAGLTFDLYTAPGSAGAPPRPVVVFVSGYSDPGFETFLGCRFKEMEAYVSWSRLVAALGLAAVTYTNVDPAADLGDLLAHLDHAGEELGLDTAKLALWACSGNVPTALAALMQPAARISCAALCYGYMLDAAEGGAVAGAAAQFGFRYPCAGRGVADLPEDVPLLVVRAGRDATPGLNTSIDEFVAAALARNLPITLSNHASAPHAFDLDYPGEATRQQIELVLRFLSTHLAV